MRLASSLRRYQQDVANQIIESIDKGELGKNDALTTVRRLAPRTASVWIKDNWVDNALRNPDKNPQFVKNFAKYRTWQGILEAGRSYLVGSHVLMRDYLRSHTSQCLPWQRVACRFCWEYHDLQFNVRIERPQFDYDVYWRGDYVEIALPHHGWGGEKNWVVNPSGEFRRKVLVNVD